MNKIKTIVSKVKVLGSLIFGDVSGIIAYLLELFNTQVLEKITCKETALMYLKDVQAASVFGRQVLENHSSQMSEEKKAAGTSVIAAIDDLAVALEDFKIDETELNSIVEKVKKAIEDWKKAK